MSTILKKTMQNMFLHKIKTIWLSASFQKLITCSCHVFMNSQFLFKNNENWLYRIGKFLTSLYCKCCCKNVLKNAGRQSWSPCCGLRFKATQNIWKKLQRERDWHRAVRRSERPPRSTKAEVINWWSADNFAFELNNSCIVGTNIFVWMPSLCFNVLSLLQ